MDERIVPPMSPRANIANPASHALRQHTCQTRLQWGPDQL